MLVDEQRKWFLEVESTPGEDAVKLIGNDKVWKYCINLLDKAAAEFERIDCNFEKS